MSDDDNVVGVKGVDESLRKISDIISDQVEPNAIDCAKPEAELVDGKVLIKIDIKNGYSSLYCVKKFGF